MIELSSSVSTASLNKMQFTIYLSPPIFPTLGIGLIVFRSFEK